MLKHLTSSFPKLYWGVFQISAATWQNVMAWHNSSLLFLMILWDRKQVGFGWGVLLLHTAWTQSYLAAFARGLGAGRSKESFIHKTGASVLFLCSLFPSMPSHHSLDSANLIKYGSLASREKDSGVSRLLRVYMQNYCSIISTSWWEEGQEHTERQGIWRAISKETNTWWIF